MMCMCDSGITSKRANYHHANDGEQYTMNTKCLEQDGKDAGDDGTDAGHDDGEDEDSGVDDDGGGDDNRRLRPVDTKHEGCEKLSGMKAEEQPEPKSSWKKAPQCLPAKFHSSLSA